MSVQTKTVNGILIIAFDNLKFANSFGLAEANELHKALKKAEKGIIFHANGASVFCSGGNLKDYAKLGSSAQGKKKAHAVNKKITTVLNELWRMKLPTAVLIEGDCFGGGVEFASAFDVILATPNAMFGLWQRRIGLSFGWGGVARLLTRLPFAVLKNLALEARNVSAYEAKDLGLVDQVVPQSLILNKALEWVEKQSKLPKAPLQTLKTVNASNEQKLFQKLWLNPEHAAILKKYL